VFQVQRHVTEHFDSMRTKLLIAIAGCAISLASGGCAAPIATPLAASVDAPAGDQLARANVHNDAPPQAGGPEYSAAMPAGAASDTNISDTNAVDPNLAGVLDKLQQVRAIDPSAEGTLLEELRRTPPNSWPLVAEQFRASLAYREQLKEDSSRATQGVVPATSDAIGTMDAAAASALLFQLGTASAANRSNEASGFPPLNAMQLVAPSSAMPPIGITATAAASATPPSIEDAHTRLPSVEPNVVQTSLNAPGPAAEPDLAAIENKPFTQTAQPPTESWQLLVAKAADELSRRVAAAPTTTAEVHQHVSLRVLRLLSGSTESALEPIPGISPTEQDYWSRQLFALATYLDHHGQPDDTRRAAAGVTHLDEAVSHLRELSSLSVRNLAFCKNVYGYGAIEAYDADVFSPGQQVSLYVEVENYRSRSTEKGFCTSLGSTYELLNEAGERVGGDEIPDVNDCCRSRRRDFHIQYGIGIPKTLAPGRYQLQLVIKDRQSDKRGHATAAFEIKGAGLQSQLLNAP
jgi:hypothetical protein